MLDNTISNIQDNLEFQIIHNKLIFDSLNQAFEAHRPFKKVGIPMPWKVNPANL